MHRTETANVLVIGTGAAGWRAAIAATQAGAQAMMLGKRPQLDAHTVLASGGLNAALGTSLVVVTHDPDLAARMDRVLVLKDGVLMPA